MTKIAVIDKYPSKTDYSSYFNFEFKTFYLLDKNIKKPLVKDITLNTTDPEKDDYFNKDEYDFVILIGADVCRKVAKIGSITKYQGYLVEDKFLPLTNPSMLRFKPEGKAAFDKALKNIHDYISGKFKAAKELNITLLEDTDKIERTLQSILSKVETGKIKQIGLDTETSALYPRDGYVLGICLAIDEKTGYYISTDYISDLGIEYLQRIFNKTIVVFHNYKFDKHFLYYHFGFEFKKFHDTMLLHYCLDERTGTHDLKTLAIKYTDLGEYDRDLEVYKRDYCKKNKVKLEDFTYDLIPFDILGKYGAIDPIATLRLFNIFFPKVQNSKNLSKVYYDLLLPGTEFFRKIEDNGVPVSKDELLKARDNLNDKIADLEAKVYNYEAVKIFEKRFEKEFNVNSPVQLREVLFNILGLQGPGKLTDTGALSTDAEVLEELSKEHELPKVILEIKKAKKIKSTYIDKMLLSMDSDGRLRTGFHLHTTTSGRASSSGKLNMQQIPRDDKTVKKCIRARKGWKIVSQDLKTAEMYVVSVLSGDKVLQKIFIDKADYHSMMAVLKFNLPYTWQEVKQYHKDLRQDAKTVSFEILYKLNFREPALENFKQLKRWLQQQKDFIEQHGYVYQFFGRKRRLPNVFSSDREVKAHEVRSGINSLVQGPSSDLNLLAAVDMQKYIEERKMRTKIFALVHDSIVAEVPDEELDEYTEKLRCFTQKDRGLTIPNCPIGVDVEIGQDYSFEEAT